MFNSLRKLISEFGEDGKHPSRFEDSDYRLAAAALLIHTAAIDGSVSDAARDKLHILIKQRFNLDDGATVISPFIVGALMANYKLPGVVWLMIGLVVIQIIVVLAWGVEPRNRALEDVATAPA